MNNACVPPELAPDLVIVNGKVITVDHDFSYAEAIAVKKGEIVAVGTRADIEALKGAKTKELDLQGHTIMPGIVDTHFHLPWFALSKPPYKIDLYYPAVKSIEDIRAEIKKMLATAKPGDWIIGEGWNQGLIKELVDDPQRKMCAADWDDIAPDNPVYLVDFSYHNAVVNTKALEAAGITKDTPEPSGGVIVRYPDGTPTGLLYEKAHDLVEMVKPPYSREQLKKALLDITKDISALGITSINSGCETREFVNVYTELAASGKYPLRLTLQLTWAAYGLGGTLDDFEQAFKYVGMATEFGNDWLKVGGAKIYADGIPPQQTAWNYDPYPDGTYGSLLVPGDTDEERVQQLKDMINLCHKNHFRLGVHCCGDRTMDVTINALVDAIEADPSWEARHFTLHGDWIRPETIKLMAKYSIGHTTQTAIKYNIADDMTARLGAERSGEQWPMREMLDAGCKVCISSDTPCSTPDWRIGVQAAVTRETISGAVSGAHQAVTVPEALRMLTIIPAWLDYAEHKKGSIEAGKLADFCILGKDITTINPHEIMSTPILMTIVGGRVVYNDDTLQNP